MKSVVLLSTFCVFSLLSLSIAALAEAGRGRGKRQAIEDVELKNEPVCSNSEIRTEYLRNLSRQSGDLECPESDFIAAMSEQIRFFTDLLHVDEDDYAVLCGNCSVPAKLFVQRCFLYPYQIQEQLDLFDGMCTVGPTDITCYSAVREIGLSIYSEFRMFCDSSFQYNGDLDDCSKGCRRSLRQMARSLGCCVRLVYGIPATSANFGYADELIWDACHVPLPSEDCFAQPPSSSPTGADTETTEANTDEAMATTGSATAIATGWGTAALMILVLASYF